MASAPDPHALAVRLRQADPSDDDTVALLRADLLGCASWRDVPATVRILADEAARALQAATTVDARMSALHTAATTLEHALSRPTSEALPPDADASLLAEFVSESREAIADAEASLLALEADADDPDAINTVLRVFHTVKGTAGFLGLDRIATVAHRAESLLAFVRDRDLRCPAPVAHRALEAADLLRDLLDAVDTGLRTGRIPVPAGYHETLAALSAAAVLPPSGPESRGGRGRASSACADGDPATTRKWAGATAPSVRVRAGKLDALIGLIGELGAAHRLVTEAAEALDGRHPNLSRALGDAGRVVRDLQDLGRSMRMVPLTPTFRKLARLVHDVSHRVGTPVEFVVAGADTEVDRAMADRIGDPLVHMLRNAIVHGIETPAERERAGKPARGVVSLRAAYAGGTLVITVHDDGRGLDAARLLEKAVRDGLVPPGTAPSPDEVFRLIFTPGFTMAERVTDLSGRGVGMDVVRERVEALRGRVEIDSTPGHGTAFTLYLPTNTAIADGTLVRVGARQYVVPTHHVHRTFRPTADQLSIHPDAGAVVTTDDGTMRIAALPHAADVVPDTHDAPAEATADGLLLVLGHGDQRAAVRVDEHLGPHAVVAIEAPDRVEGHGPGIAGVVVLPDGGEALVLDVPALLAAPGAWAPDALSSPPPMGAVPAAAA